MNYLNVIVVKYPVFAPKCRRHLDFPEVVLFRDILQILLPLLSCRGVTAENRKDNRETEQLLAIQIERHETILQYGTKKVRFQVAALAFVEHSAVHSSDNLLHFLLV